MNKSLKSTLLHTAEIAVVLIVAYIVVNVFGVRSELVHGIVIATLVAVAKYARVSDVCPIPDYVNSKK